MNFGIEKLKDIGAQKIHENTHIAKHHVQAVLHESFEEINKIQLVGFISILEREYEVDLDELKAKGLAYFEDNTSTFDPQAKVFIPPKKKKNLTRVYIVIAVAIFVFVALFTIVPNLQTENELNNTIDNSAIENAQHTIEPIIDLNISNEDNKSLLEETIVIEDEVKEITKFLIKPNVILWLGYIDLETHTKRQKRFSDEFELDPSKRWLLLLGHGNVDFELGDEIINFHTSKSMRFIYENGELNKITFAEFKELNRGDEW